MEPHVQSILKGKKLLLFKELLQSINFPDTSVADDIASGLPLSGWMSTSGHMEEKLKQSLLSVQELVRQAPARNQEILDLTGSSGDPKLDQALWEQTQKDVSQGWAALLPANSLPMGSVLSRRFGICRGSKVRAVDDFSISRVNETVGASERISVMSTGESVALGLCLVRFSKQCRSQQELQGRCFDLTSAYRQLAIRPQDLSLARVAVWNSETQEPALLQMYALPFGASASVWSFIRVALALWAIGVQVLRFPWTDFYDDFTVVTVQDDVRNLQAAIFLFFQLLGWNVATSGEKAIPFSSCFQALGVMFDLTRSAQGIISVGNTERRRTEVRLWCSEVLERNELSPAACSAFASRVRWLEVQVHGRIGRVALQVLLSHTHPAKSPRPVTLTPAWCWAVTWILNNVPDAKAKEFGKQPDEHLLLFTDGAVEDQVASIGGVLFDSTGQPLQYFSATVPPQAMQAWQLCGTAHPAFQAELLAVLVASHLWDQFLLHSLCTVFVDNEAVKHALIKGQAFPESNRAMLNNLLSQESSLEVCFWFSRVPSVCNPADAPSRGEIPSWLAQASRVEVPGDLVEHLALTSTEGA